MRKPNRPKKNQKQPFHITVAMPNALAAKLDAKAKKLSSANKRVTRSGVVRMACQKFV